VSVGSASADPLAGFPSAGLDGLERALFLGRPNRFLVECRLGDGTVLAHLPNPGRLWELLLPGRVLYLRRRPEPAAGGTAYVVLAVERQGRPIFLHTALTNRVAAFLIEQGAVGPLQGYRILRREVPQGRRRYDFLLERCGHTMLLEVKSCTLMGRRIALFPDAVTERGADHLLHLAGGPQGGPASSPANAVLFLVHSDRVDYFLPDYHTDLAFSQALYRLRHRLLVIAHAVSWDPQLALEGPGKALSLPWHILEHEMADRGSYLLILRLDHPQTFTIGSLGERFFPAGYYVYVGSALRNLSARLARHARRRKTSFWHIDYLRAVADLTHRIPIRAGDDLECSIAASLHPLADLPIPGFGSSDCACPTHLFHFHDHPLRRPDFIDLLLHWRINRIETRYSL